MAEINIICQSNDFLIIEKPVGILVHPTKYQKEGTIVDFLVEKYPEIKKIGQQNRPGIVHRLDKDVSGLMVVAKNEDSYKHLVEQFQKNQVKKKYLALVCGQPAKETGIIDWPIGRTKKGKLVAVKSRKKIKFEKSALTKYRILRRFKEHALIEVEPLTGRTHQIRLHLKAIGCPIVGNNKYAKIKNDLGRIFLHASYLGFYDLEGKWQEFKSELPKECQQFLQKLKTSNLH